jgi:7,8-dihydropterin-6-yl-methyl-4-(beta-D-ribofuranosyl)aminobenzene 5'-phosphate synthase
MSHYGKTVAGIMVIVVLLAACGPVPSTPVPSCVAAPPTHTPMPPTATPPAADTPAPPTARPRQPVPPDALRITIVYDNTAYDPRLQEAWGFAALIEYRGHTLLFDTGGDPNILMGNMDLLGIDPASIEAVALSHIHGDHVDGLPGLSARGVHAPVYILPSFPRTFRSRFGDAFDLIDVTPGQELSPGIWTTGEMLNQDAWIYEQALVISTTRGLVVVTGCAHPGIVEIVTRAKEMMAGPVYLVLGGFHLLERSQSELRAIIADFHRLGVELVAPTHCTGETAMAMFAADYGDNYVQAGVGRVLVIEGEAPATATPVPVPAADPLIDAIADLAAAEQFSGAVLVAKDGAPVYMAAHGLASRSPDVPNQTDTRFNLGSMDKMFTAVAVMQLVEQGRLSLDGRIVDVIVLPNTDQGCYPIVEYLREHPPVP